MGLVSFLFGYNGRINRTQYWLGTLGAGFAGGFIVSFITFALVGAAPPSKDAAATMGPLLLVLWGVLCVALGWVAMALQWKRFHDRGRPGWLALTPLLPVTMAFMTIVSAIVSGAHPVAAISSAAMWMMLLVPINIWFFIDLGCLAGQQGPNKYGDPPGSGGGYTPAPQAPVAPVAGASASAMSSLFGAQTAMERAIAEQARVQAAPRPAMATAGVAPSTGGAPSFGRKAR